MFNEQVKIIKPSVVEQTAHIKVGETWASISSANEKHFVSVTDGGVNLGGPLSFQGLPGDISFGGLVSFPFLPLLFLPIGPTMVPSTDIVKVAVAAATLTASLGPLLG